MKHEPYRCKVCRAAVQLGPLETGEIIVCPVHYAALDMMVNQTPHERAVLKALADDLILKRTVLTLDASGSGVITSVPLKPPRPEIIGYDDDGFVRLRDLGSPHGQTWRPGIDHAIGGSDPRLDRFRDADDDGEQ